MNAPTSAGVPVPPPRRRPARFIVAGLVNTAASYGSYLALLATEVSLPLAGLGSLLVGIGVGFLTQGQFVFGHVTAGSAARYLLAWGLMYTVHLAIVTGLLKLGIPAAAGALVALGVLTFLSYFVLRDLVFRPPGQTNSR